MRVGHWIFQSPAQNANQHQNSPYGGDQGSGVDSEEASDSDKDRHTQNNRPVTWSWQVNVALFLTCYLRRFHFVLCRFGKLILNDVGILKRSVHEFSLSIRAWFTVYRHTDCCSVPVMSIPDMERCCKLYEIASGSFKRTTFE